MIISQDVSIDYVHIRCGQQYSHGGSQLWFPKNESARDLSIHTGGCGLIAACDFMLWYENHAASGSEKSRFYGPVAKLRKSNPEPDQAAYMDCIRQLYKYFPVLPKLGSSAFFLPLFLNLYLLRNRAHMRFSFLFNNTADKRMRIIRGSLQDGYPLIMMIGARVLPFSKMKGVTFYTENEGRLKPAVTDVRRHYVTVTGIRYPEDIDVPIYLEISSWGRKYYVNYEELCTYMTRRSMPWLTGFFYVKTERGQHPVIHA